MGTITLSILAHVDAGKTTLCEALLYTAGALRTLGRVDKRDSFLDNFSQERSRGITIFSKQAMLSWKGVDITLLDTPGHADFSSEMERTLQVIDCAVLVISGTDGTQAHTDTLRVLLEKYNIPCFIFVTKMDVSQLSREDILCDLREHISPDCFAFDDISSHAEDIAVLDETVLNNYLECGEIKKEDLIHLIYSRRLFPVFFGSGLKLDGIETLLDAITTLSPEREYSDKFAAQVFKISRDRQGRRMTFMKITGGTLHVRDEISYLSNSDALTEKVTELRLYSGQKYETADSVSAGSICGVLGLSSTEPGMGLGEEYSSPKPLLEPMLEYRIVLPRGADPLAVFPKLRELGEEDPQLHLTLDNRTGGIYIRLMGKVQTEIIQSLIAERFDIDITLEKGRVLYLETISSPAIGIGHYEPLRHYAEVQLLLEPADRGSGIIYDTAVSIDDLALNWQRLIFKNLEETIHRGVLIGAPITDIKITLVAGRAHIKHTEGGDFREASLRAVRQGLMQCESVLLEPYYSFRIELPPEQLGRAITDIRSMGGTIDGEIETISARSVIKGSAPVSAMADYPSELLSFTSGRGRINLMPGGYFPCAKAENIIEEYGYNPESDIDHSPDSIFCSHGAGTVIKWNRVKEYAHCSAGVSIDGDNADEIKAASPIHRTQISIDDEEIEKIMEREFGPIRRKIYSTATVFTPEKNINISPRRQYVIIDGYNLIFAWDELNKLAESSIDAAREELINILANYKGYTGYEVAVIFDAYTLPGGHGERYDVSGLKVAYTAEGETADMYIESLVADIGKNDNVRVVTSDSLIRLAALRSGVLRTSSKEFIAILKDTIADMRKKIITQG